jgi:Heparinase II/III-like protein/Heparinase II/III N-terminus
MNVRTWLRKLGTMTATELTTRLAARAYRIYERRAVQTGVHPRHADAVVSTGPFLPSLRDLSETRHILRSRYGRETEASITRADAVLGGEVMLFGRACRVGDSIDWHLDPISGGRWPLVYHADVPIGDKRHAPGDAKHVWELNRQQFLIDLGKAWLVTGRDEYAARLQMFVRSWVEANPYGVGVNWSGPLEVAYRSLSWLWAYHLTREHLEGDRATSNLWLRSLLDHGRFLYRHLELFESPFNHLVGEASTLYILGIVFGTCAEAAEWRQRGRAILESRLAHQFYADGGSVEQAVVYHHATLGFYLLAALAGRMQGEEFRGEVWSAIERAIDHSMHLMQPDGRQPAIGDNDDARPLAFDAHDNWDFRYVQAAGAVLFHRQDFKWSAAGFAEDAFWLLGAEGLRKFDAMAGGTPPHASCALRESGYAVLRSGWGAREDYVCFDCGEQAGGLRHDDIPSAAHGHADALAVVAHLGGRPVLVDAGFYAYDGERQWERYFRETAAHNTVRVDRRDQAEHLEKMAWTHVPRVRLAECHVADSQGWAVASHDGYTRLPGGVVHRRTVWLRPRGYVIIHDELVGSGSHFAEVTFQFDEDLEADMYGDGLRLSNRCSMTWCGTSPIDAVVHRGGAGPDEGWIAPRLGTRTPAARLLLSATFSTELRLLTVVTDDECWAKAIPPSLTPECELVRHVTSSRYEDVIMAPAGRPVTAGHYQTDGCLAVWRFENERLIEATQVGGSFIRPTPVDATPAIVS